MMSDSKFDFDEYIKDDFDDYKSIDKNVNNESDEDGNELNNTNKTYRTDSSDGIQQKAMSGSEDDKNSPIRKESNYYDSDFSEEEQTSKEDLHQGHNSARKSKTQLDSDEDSENDDYDNGRGKENLTPVKMVHKRKSDSRASYHGNISSKPSSRITNHESVNGNKSSSKVSYHENKTNNSKHSHKDSSESSDRGDEDSNDGDDEYKDNYSVVSESPRRPPPGKKNGLSTNNRSQSQPNHPRPPNGVQHKRYGSHPKRGRGRGQNIGRGNTRTRSNEERSQVVNRVLSANRNKARALHNVIYELQQQIETLTIENKDLKRAARLQDREIRKLDNAEAELPLLLKKHSSEMQALQEKFRRQKEHSDKSRESLKKRENELFKTKERLQKYENMVKDKNLGELSKMNQKLHELEQSVEDKDKKISELTRSVQLHEKVRARELKEKNEKYRKAVDEMKRLEQEQKELLRRLKEKEKALEVTNIYSQRLVQRRGSNGTERTQFLFSPNDPVPPQIKRHQEEQETEYAQSVFAQSTKKAFLTEKDTDSEKRSNKMITMDFEGDSSDVVPKNKPPRQSKNSDISPQHANAPVKTLVSETKENEVDEDDDFYDSKERTEEESRLEELDRRIAELKHREEMERKEEEIRKFKAEQELEDRFARMEADRRNREEEEEVRRMQEREARRQEEEYKKKSEEQERKQQEKEYFRRMEEKEDKENIQQKNKEEQRDFERKKEEMFEKRKKKELLLAKMQAIDRGENPNKVAEPVNFQNDTKSKKKPIFLESSNTPSPKPKDDDNFLAHEPLDFSDDKPTNYRRGGGDTDLVSAKSDRRNSWEFKQTDENLHKGLPAYGSNDNSPSLKRRNTKDSDGLASGSSSGRNRIRKESEERTTSNSSGDKKGRRHHETLGDDNMDTAYSPTGLKNTQASHAKNTSKKNGDLFGQFDDPFQKANNKTNKPNKTNNLVFSSDEDDIDTMPTYEPSQPPQRQFKGAKAVPANKRSSARSLRSSNFGDDDLEEMILA